LKAYSRSIKYGVKIILYQKEKNTIEGNVLFWTIMKMPEAKDIEEGGKEDRSGSFI
jgi:hypothetical protein